MGLRRVLVGLARGAPVPVFAVAGRGVGERVGRVALDPRVRLVDTPRAAGVLLVAGEPTRELLRPAVAVHDQMSHPRCTVWWPLGAPPPPRLTRLFPVAVVPPEGDVVEEIVRVHGELLTRARESESAVQPDVDPAPWRGVGPYGQGGKGMTGGVPFGRPMAGRAPDRDGLELDQLEVRVGPFFAPFPPGLVLHVRLQGDVIQEVAVDANPLRHASRERDGDIFLRALSEAVPIAEIEVARARHHLGWLAHALRVHGLHALGLRAARLAWGAPIPSPSSVRGLCRLMRRTRCLDWATAGVGILDRDVAHAVGGPVARAAGLALDARQDDRAYEALGFAPHVGRGGDARARWRQRLSEAAQALELARGAGDRRTFVTGRVESPRGVLTAAGTPVKHLIERLPELLAGLEWGKAVTTVVSLDLDPEAAA